MVGFVHAKDKVGKPSNNVPLDVTGLARTVEHRDEHGTGDLIHPSGLPRAPVHDTDNTGQGYIVIRG